MLLGYSDPGVAIGVGVFLIVIFWITFLTCWKKMEMRQLYQQYSTSLPQYQSGRSTPFSNRKKETIREYETEFQFLSQSTSPNDCSEGRLEKNKSKNRYKDVVPYNMNRIVLVGAKNGDYINASKVGEIFIATQDPLPDQDEDFWLLLWQNDVSVIIRLSSDSTEFPMAQYVPNIENDTWVFGADEIMVTTLSKHHLNYIQVTNLKVEKEGVQRLLVVLHLTSWKAGSIASTNDILQLVSSAQLTTETLGGGMVAVHCGAGSGRTGTFIALWQIMKEIQEGRDPNVLHIVSDLRNERPGMVQTMEQYTFLHKCVKIYSANPSLHMGKDVIKFS